MKKRTWFLAAVLIVATVAAVPLVYGGPGGRGHFGGHHGFGGPTGLFGHLGEVQEKLGLSDGQVDQIKAIFRDLHEQNAAHRDQLRGGVKSIAQALLANPNDIAAAQALIERQADAERAHKTNMLNAMSRALNVLTPDQREKLGTLIEERVPRRWSRDR